MFKSLILALSVVSLAAVAQASSDTTLGIEAIEAHFKQAGLVPDLLTTFDPSALLAVSYDGVGSITPGQSLTQAQVKPTPSVSIAPANSSVSLGSNFTLVMVDADIVGTDETKGQTRHWLVNGVTLSGSGSNETVSTSSGTAITEYAGPAPASGSGPHRYVILLYIEPASFTPPSDLSTPNVGVSVFSLSDYVSSTGLTGPIAGIYLTVEVGTATVTPSVTSPVQSSTLPAASSTSSGKGTSSGSGASPTNTGSSSNGAIKTGQTMGISLLAGSILSVIAYVAL